MTDTTLHSANQELEDVLAGIDEDPDTDDDTSEGPEATAADETGPDAVAKTEARLRTRMQKAVDKRNARFAAGTEAFNKRWEARIQAKLDEVTLKQGGQAQNVEAVEASLQRQLENHKKALEALQAQLDQVHAQKDANAAPATTEATPVA